MAGGVLARAAAQGRRAAVIVLTNGDLGCFEDRDGARRQGETIDAISALGLREEDVHFLGFPDGYLEHLGATPLPPVAHRAPDGTCTTRETTLASRGAGRQDAHRARTGRPAPFTAGALTEELAALLQRLTPRDVYLPHGLDAHPDHAATYVYFRRALARIERGPVTVHRAVVHAGPCWPTDCGTPFGPDERLPALPAPLDGYAPTERVTVDGRQKLALIARYPSQLDGSVERNWLAGFARRDEAFFTETLRRDTSGRWVAVEATRRADLEVTDGATVRLEGDEALSVKVDEAQVILSAGEHVVARFDRLGVRAPLRLEVVTRRDSSGYAEWSLWGDDALAATTVLRRIPATAP